MTGHARPARCSCLPRRKSASSVIRLLEECAFASGTVCRAPISHVHSGMSASPTHAQRKNTPRQHQEAYRRQLHQPQKTMYLTKATKQRPTRRQQSERHSFRRPGVCAGCFGKLGTVNLERPAHSSTRRLPSTQTPLCPLPHRPLLHWLSGGDETT